MVDAGRATLAARVRENAPRRVVVLAAGRLFLAFVPIMVIKTLVPLRILDLCDKNDARANDWWATLLIVSNAATLLTTCAVCGASDVYGRRAGLVAVGVGLCLNAAACLVAPTLRWLVALYAASYTLGSPWALLALTFASVGDLLREADARTTAVEFAVVEGTVFVALLVVPATAGAVADAHGYRAGFGLALGAAVASLAACSAAEETLAVDRRSRADRAAALAATPVGAITFFAAEKKRAVVGLACFLHWLGMRGQEFLQPLVQDARFGMSTSAQGDTASVASAGAVLSSCVLIRLISGDDAVLVGKFAFLGTLGLCVVGASGSAPRYARAAYYGGTVLYAMELPANPALRSLVARFRGDAGLGAALGAAACLETLAQLVAAAVFRKIYTVSPGTSGFFYAAAAMASCIPAVAVARALGAAKAPPPADYGRLADGPEAEEGGAAASPATIGA